MATETVCTECGMLVKWGEYHPYAACLMYKGCHDSSVVRANLDAITTEWHAIGQRSVTLEHSSEGK